jgi:hypothetical protein
MISSNLQEKIREYAESLHVSQRGAFITASQYPMWKKRLFLFLVISKKGLSSVETLEQLLEFLDVENEKTLKEKSILSDLKKFIRLLFVAPLKMLFFAPFLPELTQRSLTWRSTPIVKILEATCLGVLI